MQMRNVCLEDSECIVELYNYYVQQTTITFEESVVTLDEMAKRIANITASYPWLIAENDGILIGYAYASAFRARPAYRFTVETTIYLAPSATGKGYGSALYSALLTELRSRQFHSAIGVIALPNLASVRLHEKVGFTKVGHLAQVGRKFEQWIDTGYWQLDLTTSF